MSDALANQILEIVNDALAAEEAAYYGGDPGQASYEALVKIQELLKARTA